MDGARGSLATPPRKKDRRMTKPSMRTLLTCSLVPSVAVPALLLLSPSGPSVAGTYHKATESAPTFRGTGVGFEGDAGWSVLPAGTTGRRCDVGSSLGATDAELTDSGRAHWLAADVIGDLIASGLSEADIGLLLEALAAAEWDTDGDPRTAGGLLARLRGTESPEDIKAALLTAADETTALESQGSVESVNEARSLILATLASIESLSQDGLLTADELGDVAAAITENPGLGIHVGDPRNEDLNTRLYTRLGELAANRPTRRARIRITMNFLNSSEQVQGTSNVQLSGTVFQLVGDEQSGLLFETQTK
jgi:hypothetical protein